MLALIIQARHGFAKIDHLLIHLPGAFTQQAALLTLGLAFFILSNTRRAGKFLAAGIGYSLPILGH